QLLPLEVRVAAQLARLHRQLALEQLALRLHRDVLPRRHRHRPSDEPGEARQAHEGPCAAATGDPEDQGHVGDEPVADTEDSRPRRTALDVAVVFGHPRGRDRAAGHACFTLPARRQRTSTVRNSWARTASTRRSWRVTTAPGHTTVRTTSPSTTAPRPITDAPPDAARFAAR